MYKLLQKIAQELLLPFTGFMTLGKSLSLFKTQFSYLPSKGDCKDERK